MSTLHYILRSVGSELVVSALKCRRGNIHTALQPGFTIAGPEGLSHANTSILHSTDLLIQVCSLSCAQNDTAWT